MQTPARPISTERMREGKVNRRTHTEVPGHSNLGGLLHLTARAMRRVRRGIPGRVRLCFFGGEGEIYLNLFSFAITTPINLYL